MALFRILATCLHFFLHIMFALVYHLESLLHYLWPPTAYRHLEGVIKDSLFNDFERIQDSILQKRPQSVAVVLSDDQANLDKKKLAKVMGWLAVAEVRKIAIYDTQGVVKALSQDLEDHLGEVELPSGQRFTFHVKVVGTQGVNHSDLGSPYGSVLEVDQTAGNSCTTVRNESVPRGLLENVFAGTSALPQRVAFASTNGWHGMSPNAKCNPKPQQYEGIVESGRKGILGSGDLKNGEADGSLVGQTLRFRGSAAKWQDSHVAGGSTAGNKIKTGGSDGPAVEIGRSGAKHAHGCVSRPERAYAGGEQKEGEATVVEVALLSAEDGKEALARAAQDIARHALGEEVGLDLSQDAACETSLGSGGERWADAGRESSPAQARVLHQSGERNIGTGAWGMEEKEGWEDSWGQPLVCTNSEVELSKSRGGAGGRNGDTAGYLVEDRQRHGSSERDGNLGVQSKGGTAGDGLGRVEDAQGQDKRPKGEGRSCKDGEEGTRERVGEGGWGDCSREWQATIGREEGEEGEEARTLRDRSLRVQRRPEETNGVLEKGGRTERTRDLHPGIAGEECERTKGRRRNGKLTDGNILEERGAEKRGDPESVAEPSGSGRALEASQWKERRRGTKLTEEDVDRALRNIGAYSVEPDLILVVGRVLTLKGFPPWNTRLSEIMFLGPLNSFRLSSLLLALSHYAGTTQRLGR